MKLLVDFSPDLVALLEQEIKAGERAVTSAMKAAGAELKQDWRDQITRAGLGHRLPRTIRNRTYPTSGDSINAAAFIWSNAPELLNAPDPTGANGPHRTFDQAAANDRSEPIFTNAASCTNVRYHVRGKNHQQHLRF